MDTDSEDGTERDKPVNKVKTWSKYVERLANPSAVNSGNTPNANSPNSNNNNNNNNINTSNMDTSNNLTNNEIKMERWDDDGLVSF